MNSPDYVLDASQYLMNNYTRYPITLTHGDGVWVWDIHGKKYLDFLTGIACNPLGHQHLAVSQAIIQQTLQILHTSNLYYSPPSIELAKCIVDKGGLDKVFFCNSGTEANEMAIKLARKYQWKKGDKDRYGILSAAHSFHGRTLGSLAATAKPAIQQGFGPMPAGFHHCCWDNVDLFCEAIDNKIAAVILEPVQGESGICLPPPKLLSAVRSACDKTGTLLIFDEIQCGVGRTGELFAYQHFNVKPDIITLAKGVANGLPLGVVCAVDEVAQAFVPGDHGSTFGGNPVSCSAALATINTIISQDYLTCVKQMGDYLLTELLRLQCRFPNYMLKVRGIGLMIGVELAESAKVILTLAQEQGLLLNVTANNVLRLLPPYIISKKDIDYAMSILDGVLGSMTENAKRQNP